ncbi:MAG: hypothetical protein LBT89_12675 [Planctomycetaceae bacterium]|jgi:hypothetical protein|nr:hypothetical protein [Planctomycetaceae bacterium]
MSFKKFAARYENKRWMRQAEKRDRREGGGRTPDHATVAHFGLISAYHREIADKNENGEPITDENGSPVINGIPYEDILAM